MATQTRDAAIVGIHEYPSRDVEGTVSPLQIKAESAARALEDAGLTWSDVDAIYDAGDGGGMGGLTIAEYFGLKPTIIDTTQVGGSSYQFHASHAKRDIAAGKASVALLTYGSTAHSNAMAIGVGGRGGGGFHPADNMESYAGMTLIANYAMCAHRHAPIRNHERAARRDLDCDPDARHAQSRSSGSDDRSGIRGHP